MAEAESPEEGPVELIGKIPFVMASVRNRVSQKVASIQVDPPKLFPISQKPLWSQTTSQLFCKNNGFNLGILLEESQDTALGYGSVFHPPPPTGESIWWTHP